MKKPAVAFDRAADAADLRIALEDRGRDAVARGEDVGGREAGRARADDDDVGTGGFAAHLPGAGEWGNASGVARM